MSSITKNALTTAGLFGSVRKIDSVWATARGASSGTDQATSFQSYAYLSGGSYFIKRFFLQFSLTDIQPSSIPVSAKLKLYIGSGGFQNIDSDTLYIVQGSQSDSLALADYDNLTFTSLGSVLLSAITTNAYNEITLNATALAYLKTVFGAKAKFAVVMGRDFNNAAPSGEANEVDGDSPSGGNPPQLVLTYNPIGGAALINPM